MQRPEGCIKSGVGCRGGGREQRHVVGIAGAINGPDDGGYRLAEEGAGGRVGVGAKTKAHAGHGIIQEGDLDAAGGLQRNFGHLSLGGGWRDVVRRVLITQNICFESLILT